MGIQKVRTVALAVTLGLAGVLATGGLVRAEALTIGAAPSLKPAFQEIVPMFQKEYGASVQVMYGASQVIRRQIEKGDPIDVFLSASVDEVEKLRKKGLTLSETRVYAQTSLVLVMSTASGATAISFHDGLPNNRRARIALGDPKTSALGQITARVLGTMDPGYRPSSNLLYGDHSDNVLSLVESGKADAGIVFRVDAIGNGHMRIVDEIPPGRHTPIQFGEAVVSTCREASRGAAQEFLEFMASPRIQKLLLKYGFEAASSDDRS